MASATAAAPPSGRLIRLATASPGSQATTRETVAQLERIARQAGGPGGRADILLVPEAYLGGYPRGSDFGCKVGARDPKGRDEFLEYFKQAVDLGDVVGDAGAGGGEAWVRRSLGGGAAVTALGSGGGVEDGTTGEGRQQRGDGTREELERIARETGVFLVVGLVEKAGGSLYCAVVYVCPHRGMIGKRRKVMPVSDPLQLSYLAPTSTNSMLQNTQTGSERLIWAQGSPATLKAVSTVIRGVRINMAAAICWESYMPLLRQAIYAQNVNLYLAPTADNRDAWMGLMRTVALEGRCFVVSSNMCVPGVVGSGGSGSSISNSNSKKMTPETAVSPHGGGIPATADRGRRNSCLTEEGFEIALPTRQSSASKSPSATRSRPRTRRRSIIDEDGNEIVLGGDGQHKMSTGTNDAVLEEEEAGEEQRQQGVSADTKTNTTTTAIAPPTAPSTAAAEITTNGTKQAATASAPAKNSNNSSSSFISHGGSSIVSPLGDVLAGPQWEDHESIIYADVDFDDCVRGRLDLDAAGSYSR